MYRLEAYEHELRSTQQGRAILELVTLHVNEVNRLINHNREVMVTWQRNNGPVFFSQFMGSAFDPNAVFKKEIEGIYLPSLIRRMAVVLQDNGSKNLVAAIDKHLAFVLEYATDCNSLHQIFQKLRKQ